MQVPKIQDKIIAYNSSNTIAGTIQSQQTMNKRLYKPSLFSIHIFPFLEDNMIFIQNGVKYMRCFGESISKTQLDQSIQDKIQGDTFVAPDYRNKILKHQDTQHDSKRTITKDNLPEHTHKININQPTFFSTGDNSGVKGDDKNTADVWIDVVLSRNQKTINSLSSQYQSSQDINICDSSLNVIFAIVIGYI